MAVRCENARQFGAYAAEAPVISVTRSVTISALLIEFAGYATNPRREHTP